MPTIGAMTQELELRTPRLVLKPYVEADLDPMAEMFGDPEVTAFTYLGRQDREGTAQVLRDYMAVFADAGYGMFAVRDTGGAYVGEAGLFVPPAAASADTLALRYALNRSAWGKGYATEASRAVIDDAFGRLGLERLMAGVVADNVASVRVMERLGFVRGRQATAGRHTFDLYLLRRDDWLRSG